jgi:hypothetical protein
MSVNFWNTTCWAYVGILGSILGINFWQLFRLQQARAKLARLHREFLPSFLDVLEHLAISICPLCALAAGQAKGRDEQGRKIESEEEASGVHIVSIAGVAGHGEVACRSAPIRTQVRAILQQEMKPLALKLEKQMSAEVK